MPRGAEPAGRVDGPCPPRYARKCRRDRTDGRRRRRRPRRTARHSRRTTRPAKTASGRAPDRVNRDFTAARPNQLWVLDLTYLPCWEQMAFTAFVTDVFSRRIVGWRTATRMPVELPRDASEMALWIRARAGQASPEGRLDGLAHHSDACPVHGAAICRSVGRCRRASLDRHRRGWL
ncbi:MAG: DDE-type integrase/transposase/recombinase [Sciscionella sp.]